MANNEVTYQTIETKVIRDLKLQDEDFITTGVDSELMGYYNEGVAQAESLIHQRCADYFLDNATITLVSGTQSYDLATIAPYMFMDKIRGLIYANGTSIYPVRRIRDENEFEELAVIDQANLGSWLYRYKIKNPYGLGRKIYFYPTPQESGALMTMWFLREAKQASAVTDVSDIPEFRRYIEQWMKVRCYESEPNPDRYARAFDMLGLLEKQMINSLSNRFPDKDDKIMPDLSFYREHT